MKRTLTTAVVLVCLFVGASPAKEKLRQWQTGKVLDTDRIARYAGSVNSESGSVIGNTVDVSGSSRAVYHVHQTYAIETGNYIYVCQERLRWRWSKPAVLTVNGPVQIAIEKGHIYIRDEEGREHETSIVKKILKRE